METPNNDAGRWTEQIMLRIRSQLSGRSLPALNTRTYNTVYESIYEVLFRELNRPPSKEPGDGV